MLKKSRRYIDDGYGSSNGDGRTARKQVGWQKHVNDNYFLDDNKDNNQQEIKQTRVDGILLNAATLLRARRIGGEQPQMGTNNGGGGASEDEDVEDNDNRTGGSGLLLINNKDDQAGGATRGDNDGMGLITATTMFIVNA